MPAALLRARIEEKVGPLLVLRERRLQEGFATGISAVDALTRGIPRGCLTEVTGPVSSGRTTLALSLLAHATAAEEFCALVDASDAFAPEAARAAGADLSRVLWVRCGGDAERALKATDLLVQGGGFGLVLMDLAGIARLTARRISLTSWFRLRRAVENTPTALVVLARESNAKSCATLALALRQTAPLWSGTPACSQSLRGITFEAVRVKPAAVSGAAFRAVAG
jgi:hypothetical protein